MNDNLIEMNCPKCNAPIAFHPSDSGARGKCPDCDAHFIIPSTLVALNLYTPSNPKEYRNFAWRRWSARIIDSLIGFMILALLFFALRLTCAHLGFHFLVPILNVAILTISFSLLFDGFIVGTFFYTLLGTTPGKKLCGLIVCDPSGNPPSIRQFFKRELRVLAKGLWLAIPPLVLIPLVIQYRRCSNGRRASYDELQTFQCRTVRNKTWFDIYIVIALFVFSYLFQNFATSPLSSFIPPSSNESSKDVLQKFRQPTKEELSQLFINDVPLDTDKWHGFSLYNGTSNFVLKTIRVFHSNPNVDQGHFYQLDVNIPPLSVFNSPFSVLVSNNSDNQWFIFYVHGVDLK